jgi:hypothetical protein
VYNFNETEFIIGVGGTLKAATSSNTIGRAVDIQPSNRNWVTLVECINASSWSLPLFLILEGKFH